MSPTTSPKTLAVIMACHNRRDSTLRCLRAFQKQRLADDLAITVYLLDDGSTDGTAEAVINEFPETHIIAGDGNLFWNRGMHAAFSAAIETGYTYYLWLNDDSLLYENALEVLLNTYDGLKLKGHECAIVGSAMQDADTKEPTYGGVERIKLRFGRIKLERIPPSDTPTQCDAHNGNCVLIPAATVEKVGNLDPAYTHRWGDHDYCFRALKKGCTVWQAPGLLGTCSRNSTDGTWEDVTLPMAERYKKLNSPHAYRIDDYARYLMRHRGPWWPAHLVWPYAKIILQTVKLRFS